MSLLLWLPLNGNIENQGLTDYEITYAGTLSFSNSGKTGKAYIRATTSASSSNGIVVKNNMCEALGTEYSISVWLKPYGTHTHYNGTIFSSGNWDEAASYAFGVSQDNTKVDAFGPKYNTYVNCTVPAGQWTHIVSTHKNKEGKVYKNGEYVGSYNFTGDTLSSTAASVTIGKETYAGGYFGFNGEICDVRVYNHCLSQKEVSELSKGLILHYKFAAMLNEGNGNLVKNGWGGLENWVQTGASYVSTTEVPSGLGITHSYMSDNKTREYIPILPDHSYTVSAYLKKYKGSTNYITLIPYDVDKLEISATHSEGLYAASLTTLTQPLKSGDTQVHVASASGWKNSGSNYSYIAFYDYRDSTGYLYPPLVYTRNILMINKADIDKTNNIIPLVSAYTGTTKASGMSVSQSTEGSTYYYPFSVNSAYTVDWYLSGKTFTPKTVRRLMPARYLRVTSLGSYQYLAGITLKDNNADLTVYDESGFGNNGTIVGTIETKQDCPRPGYSVMIGDGRSNYVKTSMLMPLYQITMNCWVKGSEAGYGTYNMPFDSAAQYEMSIDSSGKFRQGFHINGSRKVVTTASKSVTDGQWHMITATFDGSTIRRYVDGDEVAGSSTSAAGILASGVRNLYIGNYNGGTTYGSKNYSTADARIYATALSAEDIKELYNLGASIDNNGNIYTGELIEV